MTYIVHLEVVFNYKLTKNLKFVFWDIGGGNEVRKDWPHYFENKQAIIFTVDASDPVRLTEVSWSDLPPLISRNRINALRIQPTLTQTLSVRLEMYYILY